MRMAAILNPKRGVHIGAPGGFRVLAQLSGSSGVTEPLREASDTIVTPRLELRLLTTDDALHFVRLFENDWEAVKQTGRMPYPVTEAAMRDWIALHAAGSSRTFLMIRKEDGAPLGGVDSAESATSRSSAMRSAGRTGDRVMRPKACWP